MNKVIPELPKHTGSRDCPQTFCVHGPERGLTFLFLRSSPGGFGDQPSLGIVGWIFIVFFFSV